MQYEIRRSARRTVALQILPDGHVVVRCPLEMQEAQIRQFVAEKEAWLRKHLATQQAALKQPPLQEAEHKALIRRAKETIPPIVAHYARLLGVTCGHIAIRSQRTRWGSCSAKGNLNFNCLLLLAPPEVLEYVVVHELCHRLELNHSSRFWSVVEKILPRYRDQRRWLKEHGAALIARLPG